MSLSSSRCGGVAGLRLAAGSRGEDQEDERLGNLAIVRRLPDYPITRFQKSNWPPILNSRPSRMPTGRPQAVLGGGAYVSSVVNGTERVTTALLLNAL